jgi:hypothetical protein
VKISVGAVAAGLSMLMFAGAAQAEGNLAANGTNLPDLKIDMAKLAFSQTEYDLETGKYYHLNIVCDDSADDTAWVSPEFFRNTWLNQIAIDDLEVKTYGVYSLECDTAGTFVIDFVPLRPGEYEFSVAGYENRGLKGKFVVK